ncbi:alpha/beta fold hydrolase [Candidatus Chloroploca sp. Khr17]|uniref:alpha/beta fold hydrolase n=1 Tax=Candidatus Chloroploca sp. Khr17 TaxID=2496869 RepID=UPI00101D6C7A|nr:alpha/beta fold hydrolase [Candidatus Chloroploca sp. Khr17]
MMETYLNGIRLAYEDEGTGPPLLLLHAFPFNGAMWNDQVAVLRDRYRVIVPDLRGFGKSGAPNEVYFMQQYADDLALLLATLSIKQATVIGLSMGGYIAFELWRSHRSLINGLVLADTRAGADSSEGKVARETNACLVESQGSAAIADILLPKLIAPGASDELRASLRASISATSPAGIAGALRGMALRPDSTVDLPTIAVPVLVIVGTEDTLTPPSEAHLMQKYLPESELALIEGAGHLSNLEQPASFNAVLSAFLDRRLR